MFNPSDTLLRKPVRELSFEEILRRSFHVYQTRLIEFYLPFLLAGLLSGSLSALTDLGQFIYIDSSSVPTNLLSSFIVTLIGAAAVFGIISWITSNIANAIAIKLASDILEKGEGKLRQSLDHTISKLLSLLAAVIVVGIIIILGFICFIVPGIILAIMYSLILPVIIIEQVGALDSLGRSRKLVSKRWSKTFVVLALVVILQFIIGIVVDMMFPFGSFSFIISSVVSAFFQPLIPIASTFLYYSMKAKETQRYSTATIKENGNNIRFCPYCGKPVSFDAYFCQSCGKSIQYLVK